MAVALYTHRDLFDHGRVVSSSERGYDLGVRGRSALAHVAALGEG
jgi:hypothetical protein